MSSPIEWDLEKERLNRKKHAVAFTEALTALEDDYAHTHHRG